MLLHDAVPQGYLGYWVFLAPKQGLRWKHAFWKLGYPLGYLVYSLIRGALMHWYRSAVG